jgi:hypothetical protein
LIIDSRILTSKAAERTIYETLLIECIGEVRKEAGKRKKNTVLPFSLKQCSHTPKIDYMQYEGINTSGGIGTSGSGLGHTSNGEYAQDHSLTMNMGANTSAIDASITS